MKKILLTCELNMKGKRLDKFIIDKIEADGSLSDFFSRGRVQELIRNSFIKKNNLIFNDSSYRVKEGDEIEVLLDDVKEIKLKESDISLDILYEDGDLMVINKQAGLTVHPGAGNYDNTLVNALLFHCKEENLSTIGGKFRLGIVHRLDKDTSGLMVVAKKNDIHIALQEQLKSRVLKRIYNAVMWGSIIPKSGIIENYIDRCKENRLKMEVKEDGEGKYSRTNYIVLEEYANFASLVECKLDTGRTHQIRIHFSSKALPLIGDQLYGGNSRKVRGKDDEYKNYVDNFPRQALHSKCLNFIHPVTNEEMLFDSELPNDIKILINCLNICKNNYI
jgi:23S rRNA pseudouridine1911/1915/1917 synthase